MLANALATGVDLVDCGVLPLDDIDKIVTKPSLSRIKLSTAVRDRFCGVLATSKKAPQIGTRSL